MKALLLTGPSGSGKTTLAQALLLRYPQLAFSISATTRPPRPGEVPGKDYYFLEETEFEAEIQKGGFVEWEKLFSGHRYGTLRRELERIHSTGKIPLFVKDVKGTLSLKNTLGKEAISVFVLPPSIEALRERLLKRGYTTDTDLRERLTRAEEEMQMLPRFDYVLYNEDLPKALARLDILLKRYLS
ncbi:MAG: guanylate kinase [Bacteroidia bacterium]|nr:guanylate kinase [Bacteroidia bacterium]